jgi:hypothetical protein
MLMVLHTWGQNLQHHPHVHAVVGQPRRTLSGAVRGGIGDLAGRGRRQPTPAASTRRACRIVPSAAVSVSSAARCPRRGRRSGFSPMVCWSRLTARSRAHLRPARRPDVAAYRQQGRPARRAKTHGRYDVSPPAELARGQVAAVAHAW